ncbi:MAG: peptidase BlaR1 [Caulobacteraceae bacterium]|nr:peptidase BlaR1 [Caulobacteraceae bacterium]
MSLFSSHLSDPAFRLLGLSLLHFLWQGALIALALKVILNGCQRSQARYLWAFSALILMGLTPVVTYLTVLRLSATGGVDLTAPLINLLGPSLDQSPWESWLVFGWMAGVLLLGFRALANMRALAILRRGSERVGERLAERCRHLAGRMAPGWRVEFKLTAMIESPVVIGWLRPLVLIPLSAATRTPPEELEALLLHELAHVRRLDAFANLLQIMAETLLFYHPAVWWVSGVMRTEREHCCDDLAVGVTGDPARYVLALANMEEARQANDLALGAAGGSLVMRARRQLLAPAAVSDSLSWLRLAAVAIILTLVVMASGLVGRPLQVSAITSLVMPVQTLTHAFSVPDLKSAPAVVAPLSPTPRVEALPEVPSITTPISAEEPARQASLDTAAASAQPGPVTDAAKTIAGLDPGLMADRASKIYDQIDALLQANRDFNLASAAYRTSDEARYQLTVDAARALVTVVYEGAGQVNPAFRVVGASRTSVTYPGNGTDVRGPSLGGDAIDQAKLRAYVAGLPITRQLDAKTHEVEANRQLMLAAAQKLQDARLTLSELMRN